MQEKVKILGVVGLMLLSCFARAEEAPPLLSNLNESVEMIKVGSNLFGRDVRLETTIFKPNGNGPFPMVLINHGKDAAPPEKHLRSRMTLLAAELVARGYVVAFPNARGFSKSSGYNNTDRCNIYGEVADTGKDLRVLIEEFKTRPYINKDQIVLMGQSYGGLNVLGTITEPIEGLVLAINFAGGLNYGNECNWESALSKTFEKLGKAAKHDSLWFYGTNDSLFSADLNKKNVALYNTSQQRAQMIDFGSFRADAHGMFGSLGGFNEIWWPIVKPKLKEKGLPVEVIHPEIQVNAKPVIPTGFAQASEFDKLPANVNQVCRTFYENLIKYKVTPSAFVISAEGNCGGMSDYDVDPVAWAMASCKRKPRSTNCKVYFENGQVVWQKE